MAAETIVIACPECTKKFKGKAELQGKKVRCPFCKKAITVPASEEIAVKAEAAPEPPPPAPPPEQEGAFDMDKVDLDPYGMKEQELWPRCPNCAGRMETKTATICLHCGYNTLTRVWGQTIKTESASFGDRMKHLGPGIAVFFVVLLFIGSQLYYSLVLPYNVYGSWLGFLDSEAMRMWSTFFTLFLINGASMFCFKRFVIEPQPPEKKIE